MMGIDSMRRNAFRLALLLVPAAALFPRAPGLAAADRQPVYIGVRACAECHAGPAAGDQYGRWQISKHSRAFADLATPEAKAMAQLSGVPDDPAKAPVCLGCHATAADAEPWEKDPGFSVEDGVQCEKCHGPGSEYSSKEVMQDPEAAKRAGLRKLTRQDCMLCHYPKGSHVAVHGLPPIDIDAAWERIAHRVPPGTKGNERPVPLDQPGAAANPGGAGSPESPGGADGNPAVAFHSTAAGAEPRPNAGSIAPANPGTANEKVGSNAASAVTAAASSTDLLEIGLGVRYKTPLNLALSPGGRELWVACEASGTVVVVDTAGRRRVAEIPSGGQPVDVAFSPDGRTAYVSNRLDDSVSVIDTASRRRVKTLPVGDEPHGLLTDRGGKILFVLNTASDDISVIDTATFAEVNRLSASRRPWSLALSPDGTRLIVTNALSRFVPFRTPPVSEVTVLDVPARKVEDRVVLPESNLLLGAAWHPSGEFALVTLNRTKNLVPMTRMQQGWTITNGIGIVRKDGTADQLLLDEPNRYFADATDVAFTPDGKRALVTSAGTDRVAVVDVGRLTALLAGATPEERSEVIPNHLGKSPEFVVAEIPVRNSPRGVTVSPDGRMAYVANALDDSVSVIDLERLAETARIDLSGPKEITKIRRGERLFNSADIAFQRQLSCHTCHPDGHIDGLTYDIEADGIGVSPVDNRTLRGIYDTDPFKWEGTNPSLARQCGARLAVFFTRIQPFTPEELSAVNDFTVTIPLPPNRYRPLGAPLTEAQRRGKAVFERTRTADGREIPPDNRCATCHNPPYYTDRSKRDVGSQQALDRQGLFDVPGLNNTYDSAPYLHNGMADTLEEIWTRYNPYDTHGVTNDMTKDQLNDLIEYLKTL